LIFSESHGKYIKNIFTTIINSITIILKTITIFAFTKIKKLTMALNEIFKEIKSDLPASIVVFFVAVPLCLGIALASGAPLFAGIIAGIVGGIVVGIASGSTLGVSGPAAGLAVIVLTSIATLGGSWTAFLTAVVLAGVIQLIMGYAKAGFVAYFFPSSVIKGMLTGIGLIIILKQIPHALGWDKGLEGSLSFEQVDGQNTFTEIIQALDFVTPGALLIAAISLAILILWDKVLTKKHKIFQLIQGPIVVVVLGIIMNYLYQNGFMNFSLAADQVVRIPVPENLGDFFGQFTFPDFTVITNIEVWKVAVIIAIVASLETLLSVEATDKLDPSKRITPTNRELKAQGLGNIVSGLIGGLPVTQVIVRSSANINFGGKTKMSAILHGFFLLISAITIASILNMIPLASLAAILLMVGYKLAKPSLFIQMYKLGREQFVPFTVTVVAILTTDLLKGITAGMVVGAFYTLLHSYRNSHHMKDVITSEHGHQIHHLVLAEEVSFFNKANVIKALDNIPANSNVIIDCSKSKSIAYDVLELIKDYEINAKTKNITVEKINFIEPA
jgi:MFS superfamily sulfate permease-like transporter